MLEFECMGAPGCIIVLFPVQTAVYGVSGAPKSDNE